jgi:large subunit ribosomal protein L29
MARDNVHDLSDAELADELARAKAALFDARFGLATGSLEDHSQIKRWKKKIARVLTELREREIAAAEALASSGAGNEKEGAAS